MTCCALGAAFGCVHTHPHAVPQQPPHTPGPLVVVTALAPQMSLDPTHNVVRRIGLASLPFTCLVCTTCLRCLPTKTQTSLLCAYVFTLQTLHLITIKISAERWWPEWGLSGIVTCLTVFACLLAIKVHGDAVGWAGLGCESNQC